MKWINAEQQVTVTIYDEEHEEHLVKTMTVEETLDTYTNEGCPTIYSNPERKKSKWIEFDSSEDKYDVIKCPCCKHTFTVDSYHWTDIGFIKDDFKFCPNCGADMRGKE